MTLPMLTPCTTCGEVHAHRCDTPAVVQPQWLLTTGIVHDPPAAPPVYMVVPQPGSDR